MDLPSQEEVHFGGSEMVFAFAGVLKERLGI
jgi:hypothetical protein